MKSRWHHWCNIAIGIWCPRWIPKQRPDQLGPSTTIFNVSPCIPIILRILPILCLYPVISLQRPSLDAYGPLPRSGRHSSSLTFISTLPVSPSQNFPANPPTLSTIPWSYCRYYPSSSPYHSLCWITRLQYSWSTLIHLVFIHLPSIRSNPIFSAHYPLVCLILSVHCLTLIAPLMIRSDLHFSLGSAQLGLPQLLNFPH